MRRSIYTNQRMETASPVEFGLEAVQGTTAFRPVGAAAWLPRAAVWPVDPQRRSVSHHQRPPAESAPGSHSRGQVVASYVDDREAAGSIYLVAVPRDVLPPVFFGNALLQRMRAVLLSPGADAPGLADHVVNIPWADLLPSFDSQQPPAPPARSVSGEILRDEQGNLYERNGSSIRRLRNLSSSRRGELVETGSTKLPQQNRQQPASGKAFHQFFRDPGVSRVLAWGQYKGLLHDQVSKPQLLRDNHRLSCFAQVYENFVMRTPEEFARECFGDVRVAGQLFELTDALADRLKIAPLLPRSPDHQQDRQDGMLSPGDRILRLRLSLDPTVETPSAAPASSPVSTAPVASVAPVAAAPVPEVNTTSTPSRQSSIPERFLTPWELLFTREQVLSEMQLPPSRFARLRRGVLAIFGNGDLKRWRRQLWGKAPDEQLWGVRPPKRSLQAVEVFDWAKATLIASGYDPSTMLREWEIFWRQKGL
jgi:hypothetical protein